jgi:23S rRNA (adenine2503-C2)-methyltransferase
VLLVYQVARFRSILIKGGKVCTLRMSKGDDEMAACGQLGDPGASPRPAPLLQPPERLKAALASA